MKIVIPNELEEKLRKHIAIRKGMRKGAISESIKEAIELWLLSPNSSQDLQDPQDPDKFREEYPGKYLAIANNIVLIETDSLKQLFEEVALITEKVYIVHPEPKKKRIRVGWRSQVKS